MITLLSDFGHKDAYVAVMKGVIAEIAPEVTTCDLTHALPPQNILAARFNLMQAYPYFPQGTVHLAVVDPGVGSARRAIALHCDCGFFVAPDNGLLAGVAQQEDILAAVSLTNRDYWRVRDAQFKPSNTFHGRDIFAPVAAHLAKGVSILALGDHIDPATLVTPAIPPFTPASPHTSNIAAGSLQYIDGFGNLITNIPAHALPNGPWKLTVSAPSLLHRGELTLAGVKTYSDVPHQTLVALVGSHGWVEIAQNGGSAAQTLDLASLGNHRDPATLGDIHISIFPESQSIQ